MPSTEKNNFIYDMVRVGLVDRAYYFQIYDTPLGHRWLDALKDNLEQKRILEKNFCFLGFADSKRNLNYLVAELNKSIAKINAFEFDPVYEKIHPLVVMIFNIVVTCRWTRQKRPATNRILGEHLNMRLVIYYIGISKNCKALPGNCQDTTNRPTPRPNMPSGR